MVTPFAANGDLDLDSARRLARYLVDNGSHGLVVAGTTGESPTLSDGEKISLLEAVLDEIGDEATVIAGTGSNDTRHTVELTTRARDAGADAVLVVAPYYNKPNEAGLRAHFAAVSVAAAETPIVLYNIPSRSAINLPPELLSELANQHRNIVAVKQANNDDLGPIAGLEVLAGNDEIFARTLGFGGAGGILVASNAVGPQMRELYEAAIAGDDQRAERINSELRPVYEAMAVAPGCASAKAALELLGIIDANLRLPMVPASDDERRQIRAALERCGLPVGAGA